MTLNVKSDNSGLNYASCMESILIKTVHARHFLRYFVCCCFGASDSNIVFKVTKEPFYVKSHYSGLKFCLYHAPFVACIPDNYHIKYQRRVSKVAVSYMYMYSPMTVVLIGS